ncbi:odorant receptor 4-like [Epargyreus clarus]|uniref:odorant receptor 4-like n=1 Tax=Epargyreus clarus TaxID=520877 RepID=UPI003C2F9751
MIQTVKAGLYMNLFKMMPCVGYLLLAMAKSYKIVWYRPVFENLVDELRGMWPQGEVSEEEHRILSKALKQLRIVTKGYYWCNVALNAIFTGPPFVEIAKRLAGKDVPLILSFFYWLPFDPFQRGYYEVVLVLQSWHCLMTVWFMLSSDLLFCMFLSHITTQFDLLAVRITKLFQVPIDDQLVESYPLADNNQNTEEMNDDAWESKHHAELTEIILRHGALIRLSGDVENMFTFSLLLNFLNGSVIMCFCGFCVVFVEKWNEVVYKIFLVTATTQIWLLCWYGQRLLDASEGVSEALYNSGWYTSSMKIKKSILIMIHRSQKQVQVTTYGFSIICLATYSTIIKTSWSYFTLLINMYE